MTALDRLPANAVLPLGRRRPEVLAREARDAGQRVLRADCGDAPDKPGVMAALAAGLAFPAHFGANLDALYDCLTDLEPGDGATGLVLIVERLPGGPAFDAGQREALLETFRDAAEDFAARDLAFRVFWSARPEGVPPPG
jgi:RNAse (barnase) inhibitor barstar